MIYVPYMHEQICLQTNVTQRSILKSVEIGISTLAS